MQRINETKSSFFEKNQQGRQTFIKTTRHRRNIQINNKFGNEKGDIKTNTKETPKKH